MAIELPAGIAASVARAGGGASLSAAPSRRRI
jgi:hypothetical protein